MKEDRKRAARAFKAAYQKAKLEGFVVDQADAADKFGVHRTYVAQMGTGQSPISLEYALKAGDIFHCEPHDVADDEVRALLKDLVNKSNDKSVSIVTLPRLLVRDTGDTTIVLTQVNDEDDPPVQFLKQWAIKENIDPSELVDVVINHEFPGLNAGDHLIAHRQPDTPLQNNTPYVFSLVGENIVRRVFIDGSTITLINGDNPPQITSKSKMAKDGYLVVGPVFWLLGQFK